MLWPDSEQDEQKLARVPMLSRWNMSERSSGNHGLLQVQYAFLELPKLPTRRPETGASQWAWLFVHAPELTEVPLDLPPGPHREALELANEATFTQAELDAYRRVSDEIQQARDLADAAEARGRAEGETAGFEKGETAGFEKGETVGFARGETAGFEKGETAGFAKGKAEAILAVLAARGIPVHDALRARIAGCTDAATLARWLARAVTGASIEEVIAPAS